MQSCFYCKSNAILTREGMDFCDSCGVIQSVATTSPDELLWELLKTLNLELQLIMMGVDR